MGQRKTHRKVVLRKHGKRTKWAPVWAVLKKYGIGKKVHSSSMTRIRRSWKTTKLKIKPRKMSKKHLG